MPDTRVFNESVFHSYSNLQNFFNQSPSVQEVLSKKNEPYSGVAIPIKANLSGKWLVCQIASAPFRWLLRIYLDTIEIILEMGFNATHAANRFRNWSSLLKAGFQFHSEDRTKLFNIATARNHPNQEGKRVNNHPAIPASRVPDKVRKRTFCSIVHEVKFRHNRGICRGMRDWFLNLYLKTKNQFADPRAHIAAIMEQFTNGGGLDPTLMHSIFIRGGKLLNLRVGKRDSQGRWIRYYVIRNTIAEFREKSSEMVRQIKGLPAGAYAVGLPTHATAFIKINDQLGYFFDPNHGAIEISGNELSEKLYEELRETLERTYDEKEGEASEYIDFSPIALRN